MKLKTKLTALILITGAFILSGCGKEPVQLESPTITDTFIDGEKAYFEWDEVENATSYRVTVNDETNDFPGTTIGYRLVEGNTANISVTALGDGKNYLDSAPTTITMENPMPDYSKFNYYKANFLSYEQLTGLCRLQGYNYEESESDGIKVVHITITDSNNTGLKNVLGRAATGFLDSIFGSYEEASTAMDPEDIFNDTIDNYMEHGDLKESYKEAEASAEEKADRIFKAGLLKGTFSYIAMDTDIHYFYYFDANDLDKSCISSMLSTLEHNNMNILENISENADHQWSDTVYSLDFTNLKQRLFMNVGEDKSNSSYPRWTVYCEKERIR